MAAALDTNVLIYACDKSDPRRQQIALELIATVKDGVLLWAGRVRVRRSFTEAERPGLHSDRCVEPPD